MNPEIKKRWIEALTGGQYKKITGELERDGCYCALGVLCDLYSKENNFSWGETMKNGSHYVYRWAEIPLLYSTNIINTIIELNDNENYTFEQTAEFIEKNL